MFFYHVVSDRPKQVGQHFVLDENHPNGVHDRELSILITYSVYGGYYSYLKHIKSGGETVDVISDLSERLMKK